MLTFLGKVILIWVTSLADIVNVLGVDGRGVENVKNVFPFVHAK